MVTFRKSARCASAPSARSSSQRLAAVGAEGHESSRIAPLSSDRSRSTCRRRHSIAWPTETDVAESYRFNETRPRAAPTGTATRRRGVVRAAVKVAPRLVRVAIRIAVLKVDAEIERPKLVKREGPLESDSRGVRGERPKISPRPSSRRQSRAGRSPVTWIAIAPRLSARFWNPEPSHVEGPFPG
jgi:hypothetical protein